MRIGIYGGSFNPIHQGHVSLAEAIVEQDCVDEVWLLVSPLNPLKQETASDIADYHHRFRMAELATADKRQLKVSDFETRLPIPSYMVNTLKALSETYPEHKFSLVIGADNWEQFHKWYRHEEIINRYDILIYRRPHCHIDESSLPPSVRVVDTPLFDISSTQIRAAISQGKASTKWLDEKVAKYIREFKVYG